jgi:DNA-binding Xre family transcriptional regulator
MGISYKPLLKLLVDRNITKTSLAAELGFSSATLAKLGKGEPLSGSNIEKLCNYFHCQVQDIVEIVWNDEKRPATKIKPICSSPKKKPQR